MFLFKFRSQWVIQFPGQWLISNHFNIADEEHFVCHCTLYNTHQGRETQESGKLLSRGKPSASKICYWRQREKPRWQSEQWVTIDTIERRGNLSWVSKKTTITAKVKPPRCVCGRIQNFRGRIRTTRQKSGKTCVRLQQGGGHPDPWPRPPLQLPRLPPPPGPG